MQRRGPGNSLVGGIFSSSLPSRHLSTKRGEVQKKRKFNPIIAIIGVAILISTISWRLFPDELRKAENEAQAVGQRFAERAIEAEHSLQGWMNYDGNNNNNNNNKNPTGAASMTDRAASDAASQAMLLQSSKWVDGEKKLKKKLTELYEKQQKGELLGVPVLTRWLGDDFPAWVTPDMDEQKWREDVATKYKEMRDAEEEWKKEMQKLIEQRERELGLLSP